MSSIMTARKPGRLRASSHDILRYCAPPSGTCVRSCSSSERNSWLCTVSCQFISDVLRFAFWIFLMVTSPSIKSLAGPCGGRSSLMARDAKSMHASVIIGWTTFDAPLNCAPPGASSPRPVRRMPSSYCSSRFLRASLSRLISSRNFDASAFSSGSGIVSARLS